MEQKKQLRPDGKLISSLYNEYADDLRRYLCSCLHNMDDAEDMLHDLFIKVMEISTFFTFYHGKTHGDRFAETSGFCSSVSGKVLEIQFLYG